MKIQAIIHKKPPPFKTMVSVEWRSELSNLFVANLQKMEEAKKRIKLFDGD